MKISGFNRYPLQLAAHAETANLPGDPADASPRGRLWQRKRTNPLASLAANSAKDAHRMAFVGIWLFTLVMYLRPQEYFPPLAALQLGKVVSFLVPFAYYASKSAIDEKMIWPIEVKLIAVLNVLAILFLPFAASRQDSMDVLTDSMLKVLIMIPLMANVVKTREKLVSLWKVVAFCGAIQAVQSLRGNPGGEFGHRVSGTGMLGNPNDLAALMVLIIPCTVILAIKSKGLMRMFYIGSCGLMTAVVFVTFSRGGFLGLVLVAFWMVWKIGRGKRLKIILASIVILVPLMAVLPGGYGGRIATIFDSDSDTTGSSQARRKLLEQGMDLALKHPIVGIGIGNFDVYSLDGHVAHNSYVEIAAELGWIGFVTYLGLLFSPLIRLRRLERQTADGTSASERDLYLLCIGAQAMLLGYMVESFFASIQYQWFIYYIVAYSITLRQFEKEPTRKPTVLWDRIKGNAPTTPKPGGKLRGRLWASNKPNHNAPEPKSMAIERRKEEL
jgi:putative inorganic carbon (hco3(-)) transporter